MARAEQVERAAEILFAESKQAQSAREVEMRVRFIRGGVLISILALAMTAWVMNSSAQGVKPVPGAGTGIVMVEGTVNVANTPTVNVANMPPVNATQSGDWRVSVVSAPPINVPSPEFLQPRRSYTIIWADNSTDRVVIDQVGPGSWVRVGRRWLNLAQAQSVEETAAPR